MTDKEINEQFTAKVQRGIFKPVARHLTSLANAEDRMQDAVAQTWWMYRRYAERGKVLPDAILVHSCRQRAVDLNRHFVPAAGTRRSLDVMDPRCYRDRGVELLHLVGNDEDQPEGDRALQLGYAEEQSCNPERQMNSGIDLQDWVGGLSFQDQGIMRRKMEGFGTGEVAAELGLPYLVTWRKEKRLGHELARRANAQLLASNRQSPLRARHHRPVLRKGQPNA